MHAGIFTLKGVYSAMKVVILLCLICEYCIVVYFIVAIFEINSERRGRIDVNYNHTLYYIGYRYTSSFMTIIIILKVTIIAVYLVMLDNNNYF
jgi:hypothetical protein